MGTLLRSWPLGWYALALGLFLAGCQTSDSRHSVNAEGVSGGDRASEAVRLAGVTLADWVREGGPDRGSLCEWRGCGAVGRESPVCVRTRELNADGLVDQRRWVARFARALGKKVPAALASLPVSVVDGELTRVSAAKVLDLDARVVPADGGFTVEFHRDSVLTLSNAELSSLLFHEVGHTQTIVGTRRLLDEDRVPPYYDFDGGGQRLLNDAAACAVYDALVSP